MKAPQITLLFVEWMEHMHPSNLRPKLNESKDEIFYREGGIAAAAKVRHEYERQQEESNVLRDNVMPGGDSLSVQMGS